MGVNRVTVTCETERHSDSKDCLGKVCVLHHGVHHFQSYLVTNCLFHPQHTLFNVSCLSNIWVTVNVLLQPLHT